MFSHAELINSAWQNPAPRRQLRAATRPSLGILLLWVVREQKVKRVMLGMVEPCSILFQTLASDRPRLRQMIGCGEFRLPPVLTLTLCETRIRLPARKIFIEFQGMIRSEEHTSE